VIHAANPWLGGSFGETLVLNGNTLVVGEPGYGFLSNNPASWKYGRLHVYELIGDTWEYVQPIRGVSPNGNTGIFGWRFDFDGETIVVGQNQENDPSSVHSGVLYVFERNATGNWIQVERILAAPFNSVPSTHWNKLGSQVKVQGDLILASANFNGIGTLGGAVFAYRKVAGNWVLEHQFVEPYGFGFGEYAWGRALAVDGNRVAISAVSNNNSGNNPFNDVVILYEKVGTTGWVETGRIFAPGPGQTRSEWPRFGSGLAMQGEWLWIGAEGGREPAGWNIGRCHLFRQDSRAQWNEVAQMRHSDRDPSNNWQGDWLGKSVAADFENGHLVATAQAYISSDPNGPVSVPAVYVFGGAYMFDLERGQALCPGSINSTGRSGMLSVTGNPSVQVGKLTLHAYDLPPGEFALFLYGQESHPHTLATGGNLCVAGGPIYRVLPGIQVGEGGGMFHDLDFQASYNLANLLPGTTWAFQTYYRDRVNGNSVTNTTRAVRLTLQ
jgi:hypothetical protein